jgi:hypothetical protein
MPSHYRALLNRVLVGIAATALVATAAAAPPARKLSDELPADAQVVFQNAKALFDRKNFVEARSNYERAFELSKDNRVLYNVAVCFKEEGHFARAIRTLERSISDRKKLPQAYIERVTDTMVALKQETAAVQIDLKGASASGAVDTVAEFDGETLPLSSSNIFLVDAGSRVLVVKRPAYAPQTFRKNLAAGEQWSLTVELLPLPGSLKIASSSSKDVSITVDGKKVGIAPIDLELAPGNYDVEARAPGFADLKRTVTVAADAPKELLLQLERKVQTARLRIVTTGTDVISLDGTIVGRGFFDGTVAAGEHRVQVSGKDIEPRLIELVLQQNEVRDLRVDGTSKASGIPAWAWVLGGAAVAGAASTALYFTLRPTDYVGSSPGSLNPRFVPASTRRGL